MTQGRPRAIDAHGTHQYDLARADVRRGRKVSALEIDRHTIEANLERVRGRVDAALRKSGRTAGSVEIIAVTKAVGIREIVILQELGLRHFGENRPVEAEVKIRSIHGEAIWHMVGTIQRRKARDVVRLFDRVDAVDRVAVAEALARHCEGRPAPLPILLEVNVSGEASKHGFAPGDLSTAIDSIGKWPRLRIEGLMTMAPLCDDPERTRPYFAALRTLAEACGLSRLSMGMSNDFEIAIEEGATEVRIGTALFESEAPRRA